MAQEPTPQHERAGSGQRPAWLLPAVLGGAVVVVAAIVVGVLVLRPHEEAAPVTPSVVVTTVVAPVPTTTIAPVARETQTAFTSTLPGTVLQYALASSAPNDDWQAAGALEGWEDTYTDGGSGRVTVASGQWATPDEATAFAAQLVGGLPTVAPSPAPTDTATPALPALPTSGTVDAGGASVGTFTIVDAGGGVGIAVWTNGTAVFQLSAPVDEIVGLYAAYPL
jgi:hypothetical protein